MIREGPTTELREKWSAGLSAARRIEREEG